MSRESIVFRSKVESEKGELKVAKVQSGKATKCLCTCGPMGLCAFQIEFDLELNLKKQSQY